MPGRAGYAHLTTGQVVGRMALAAGLLAAVTHRVGFAARSQLAGAFPFEGESSRDEVALTFDDGPNEPHTSVILDALQSRGAAATFFQVGRCAERYPEVTRRVVADGHVLANHSYSHTFRSYASHPTQRDEVERGRAALMDIAGVSPRLYRPPWLCHWPWVLRGVAASGSQVVSGTFGDPLEITQPRSHHVMASTMSRARPGAILILHDGREARGGDRSQTAAAVGPLVDRLQDQGLTLTTVDRLLGGPAYD